MTKMLKLSALAAALMVSASAYAVKPGYLTDQATDNVVRNNYGECWRTGTFDKAQHGLVECGDRAPVAPVAEAPKPVLVAVKEKVTLSAKVLFDFDKATLRADAKNELDPLVARLKGDANLRGVEVAGHTDFFGTEKYNQALSERRANAVRNYFVANGVPAEKVTAVGKGKSETQLTQQCQAQKLKRTALKACVEGDRRVEVTIDTSKESVVQQPAK